MKDEFATGAVLEVALSRSPSDYLDPWLRFILALPGNFAIRVLIAVADCQSSDDRPSGQRHAPPLSRRHDRAHTAPLRGAKALSREDAQQVLRGATISSREAR